MNTPSLESIVNIVKEASGLMISDGFEISQKEGFANIVTSSDVAVQDFLCSRLAELLPGSGFLCEEEDMWDTSHDFTWIIDPIDGTANYSRGIAQCAISVALKRGADVVAGVVFLPRTDELFTALKGKGAWLNSRRISVSERPFADSVMCTALPVYYKEHTGLCSAIISDTFMRCNDIRRFGAAAPELCYLAMGRCELYFEYMLSPWDFAAASLVLTEAGGTLTDLGGRRLTCVEKSGVIAANSTENHAILLDIVRRRTENARQS